MAEVEESNDHEEVDDASGVRFKVQDEVVSVPEWDCRNDKDAWDVMQEETG